MYGPRGASAPTSASRRACALLLAGCGCCCTGSASPVAGSNTPSIISKIRRKSLPAGKPSGWRGKKVRTHPERYELHYQDETHLDTNPYLSRVWHRIGTQPTLPAAGTNRRLTVFGSVEARGRGRIELLTVQQDSAGFARYLAALDARHAATGRRVILVLDNGPCHGSTATRRALAERAAWLEVLPLARYSPHLNPKEHEWRRLKRDHRGHLAGSLREFVEGV